MNIIYTSIAGSHSRPSKQSLFYEGMHSISDEVEVDDGRYYDRVRVTTL